MSGVAEGGKTPPDRDASRPDEAAPLDPPPQPTPAQSEPSRSEPAPPQDAEPETGPSAPVPPGSAPADPAPPPSAREAFPEPDERTRISGHIPNPFEDDRTRVAPHRGPGGAPDDSATRVARSADATFIAARDDDAPGLPPPMPTVVSGIAPALPSLPTRLVEPGTLINNNYRIEALVSAGGMGEVYRAVNVFTGDPVAVKVILPELARDQDIIDLFRREARVLVQLRDDAIVSYHNFILDQGLDRYCLIMEFVEGTHLGNRMRDRQGMADDEAIRLLRRLAGGLRRAHARGVTHRDLSPDNVILRHDRVDEAVLIDFGIARSTELGDGLAGRFAGKFKYIAPEQLGHFNGTIGPQTDAYGLALLMAAVMRGVPVDMGDSALTASAARQAIPDLSGLSHRVFPLLQHMLEPDPVNRPADMGQVIAMLGDPMLIPARYRLPLWDAETTSPPETSVIGGHSESPFGTPGPRSLPPHPEPAPATPVGSGRGAALLIAGGLALLAAAVGGGWFAMTRPDSPAPDPEVVVTPPEVAALPPRDPASRDGFLAGLPLGDCAMAQRITAGPQRGMIALFDSQPLDPARVQDAFEQAFHTRPAIDGQRITDAQCPALSFVNALSGRIAAPPVIEPRASLTPTGFQMEARVSGLTGRNLWLALIAPDGAVYDLTGQSSATADGSVTAGAAIDLPQGMVAGADAYLLLALTSSGPLAAIAAAPAGAPGATMLPALLTELQSDGDAAAATLAALTLAPAAPPETPPADAPENPAPDQP